MIKPLEAPLEVQIAFRNRRIAHIESRIRLRPDIADDAVEAEIELLAVESGLSGEEREEI